MRVRWTAGGRPSRAALAAAIAAVAVALAGCGPGGPADPDERVAASGAPPRCSSELGPTGPVEALGFDAAPSTDLDQAWEAPGDGTFDWDGDGTVDRLVVDRGASTVSVEWDEGSFTVTGVRSDFGPDEVDSPVVPATVAEVTGDDHPDLIVAEDGVVAVLAGDGRAPGGGLVPFDEIGTAVPGWSSPPTTVEAVGQEPVSVPFATGTVVAMGDVSGDGIDDFRVYSEVRRARGPAAFYEGRRCDP